ncbi:MAG TPA: class I fructose-bisphosphate aldolase, partial [Gammaproteobacteria bacterium]
MNLQELARIAHKLVADHRGILAADESTSTIEKRFKSIGVENTEEHRRAYRDMLFSTPGAAKFISGVIMYDETIRQKSKDGTPFAEGQAKHDVIPGIKVDKGVKELPGSPQEKITEGLDGLRERLQEYHKLGARFAKWRAVIDIAPGIPTDYCIRANAQALARYAALCQVENIVPIVEPEVLMDGDHDIARCLEVTSHTLRVVFEELANHRIALEGMLLKPNMVIAGKKCSKRASVDEVADKTVRVLKACVPAAVPGIAF